MRITCFLTVVLIAAACSPGTKNYKVPERAAVSPGRIGLFADSTAISNGKMLKRLSPGATVYCTDDTLRMLGMKFIRVVWGDSSAYAIDRYLLRKGKLAVITSGDTNISYISIYADSTRTDEIMLYGASVISGAAVPTNGDVTEILHLGPNGPAHGYVLTSQVEVDSMSVVFFKEYYDPLANRGEADLLLSDPRFANLRVKSFIAPEPTNNANVDERGDAETGEDFDESDDTYAEGDGEYGDVSTEQLNIDAFLQESSWTEDGIPLEKDRAPATFKKYFELVGGGEIVADGYSIYNGKPYSPGNQPGDKKIFRIRFDIVLNKKCDVRFVAETMESSGMTEATELFNHVLASADDLEPGKVYSTYVADTEAFCKLIRVTAWADRAKAVATVSGDCDH